MLSVQVAFNTPLRRIFLPPTTASGDEYSDPLHLIRVHTLSVAMNLTLSIDKELLSRAREAARAQGKSVNQMVREYLEELTTARELEAELAEFHATCRTGDRRGWKFDREELHERT